MKVIGVNEAIRRAKADGPQELYLQGLLVYAFEEQCINHWPRSEAAGTAESSIWLVPSAGVFHLNAELLATWSGKRVIVLGSLCYSAEGHGHMGLWDVQVVPTEIHLWKRWRQHHPV